jgi:hypothetical protein
MTRRPILMVLLWPATAWAGERGYTVTDYDQIQVEGPFAVTLETGKAPTARATGTPAAIDQLSLKIQGRTLIIRMNKKASGGGSWKNEAPSNIAIRLSAVMIHNARLSGSGSLSITRMRAQRVSLGLFGSGTMSVGQIDADRLDAGLGGSATLNLGGKAANAALSGAGSGAINGQALKISNLQLSWSSAGNAIIGVSGTAKINSAGAGNVTVVGPAACTVTTVGAGQVNCGK